MFEIRNVLLFKPWLSYILGILASACVWIIEINNQRSKFHYNLSKKVKLKQSTDIRMLFDSRFNKVYY
jgi:hypothetical protein